MSEISTYRVEQGVAVIRIDSPPVNALGIAVRRAIDSLFRRATEESDVNAIVLICGGRTFFAGADISEFGKPPQSPGLVEIIAMIEASKKPVVAAIHGTALGGGYELALVCDFRIAVPSAKVGLPEVHLGILPGAGGTQRLPRIVGPEAAVKIITSGRPVPAKKAAELGMIDAVANSDTSLEEDAIAFAARIVAEGKPVIKIRNREDKIADTSGFQKFVEEYSAKNARAWRGLKAPYNIIKAIEAAITLPFDEGMARENELFQELYQGTEASALRYLFFAERQTSKIPDLPADAKPLPIKKVGVVGAGTMGGGITMALINAGIPVTLVEQNQEALVRGVGVIRKTYDRNVQKGRMSEEQLLAVMDQITPTVKSEDLADVDLVIEAVYESMEVKKELFAKLDKIVRNDTILASNTSFLNIDEIAAATSRPQSFLGLHFFSPANIMPLLEVVRGAKTSPEALKTALALAKAIRKTPVVSRVCHGFIANRLMLPRALGAYQLVLEGPTPQEVDKALYDYGFAVGHFAMMDMVGLDVVGRDSDERTLAGDMVARGRLGQKQNGGFYDYDANRQPTPSPVAAEVIAEFAAYKGVTEKISLTGEEIVARLLYPVVNEGAKILEEGIAIRASDIDMAAVLGYNWPRHRGGPMFWADQVGLNKIVAELRQMGVEPAPLLVERAEKGLPLSK